MRGIGGIEAVPILQRRRAFGGIDLDAAAQDLAQLDAGAHLRLGSDLVGLEAGILLLDGRREIRSEEHTSELQSLMRSSYAVFCLIKKKQNETHLRTQEYTTHTTST